VIIYEFLVLVIYQLKLTNTVIQFSKDRAMMSSSDITPVIENNAMFKIADHIVSTKESSSTRVFFTRAVIFQKCIIFLPVCDFEFHNFVFFKKRVGNTVLLFRLVQNGNSLMLEAAPEPD